MSEEQAITENEVGSAEEVLNEKPAAPKPAPKKRAIISIVMDDGVNENDFKTWLKTCPVSLPGDQSIRWEKVTEQAA